MKKELLDAMHDGNINKVLYLARDLPEHAKASIPLIVLHIKKQPKKFPPLFAAIIHDNYHLCKLLIEAGVSVNKDSASQVSLLSLALQEKFSDIAELLITSGADVNTPDVRNGIIYPMYFAIYHNNPASIVEKIILAGFPVDDPVIQTDKNLNALQCACLSNNTEAAEVLVKYKANIDAVNVNGDNAITFAVRGNFLNMVKFLVSKGAKLENKKTSICPLFLAIRMELVKMVELLLDLGASITEGWVGSEVVSPLQFACSYLNISIIKLLVSKGADVNGKSKFQETPLHVVCSYIGLKYTGYTLETIQTKIAKILIDKGACVNVKDCDGRTPLDCAIYSENTELCKLLIREGADIAQKGCINGMGIIDNRFEYIACVSKFKCPELIKLCLERGCDYNYRDKHGLTPYHCVLAKYKPEMIKMFWKHGCPFDQPELIPGKMKTMLWYDPLPGDKKFLSIQSNFIEGVKENKIELVIRALKKGAEPRGCSMTLESTLHYVAANGNDKMIRLLLENGVSVNKINKEGKTALWIGMEKQHLQTCIVLLQFGACFNYQNPSKGKTFKELAEENKTIYSLFKIIYHTFKMAKEGNLKLLSTLKQCVNVGNSGLLNVLMNCVNRQGLSLTGIALESGHFQLAKELMNLRIENMF